MIQLMLGDCLESMRGMADNCIDLTVTSPPYDNLRTYNGFSWDFEGIARELFRVTRPGGVVVWVVGDATIKGSETGTSFRQALFFKEIGFNLHDTMIYQKLNYLPQNAKTRYDQCFEFIFVLSKGEPATANLLRDRRNAKAGQTLLTGGRKNKDGVLHDKRMVTCSEFGIRSNIWPVPVGGKTIDHPAPMPESLCDDLITSWSNPGDTVLDPFLGSGTTGKMAVLAGRNFIGCEISSEYMEIARARIEAAIASPSQSELFKAA